MEHRAASFFAVIIMGATFSHASRRARCTWTCMDWRQTSRQVSGTVQRSDAGIPLRR
jgi:hypothetical protein